MLMRVAVGIHGSDIDAAIETYDLLSEKWFTHATPTLFNAGKESESLFELHQLNFAENRNNQSTNGIVLFINYG